MDMRVTIITVIRSGQPRAYADTEFVAQITFQKNDGPELVPRSEATAALLALENSGFTVTTRSERADHFDSYLDYLRPVGPVSLAPVSQVSAVWEYRVVTPYTD